MATEVGEMSPGDVRCLQGGELATQVGEMSPGEVRWPHR